jgi:hypothetical protein
MTIFNFQDFFPFSRLNIFFEDKLQLTYMHIYRNLLKFTNMAL